MKKIFTMILFLLFSCTSPVPQTKNINLSVESEKLNQLLHLATSETITSELSKFNGTKNIKEIKNAKIYSFRKDSDGYSYLILKSSKNENFISALYYPDKKNELNENEIKEKIQTDDWQVQSSHLGKDDRTEKVIVFSIKKKIEYGYYKEVEGNHINFIYIGSANYPFEVKEYFLY